MKPSLFSAPTLAIASLLLAACSDVAPVDRALEKNELIWSNGTEIQGLDPHIVTGVPENRIMMALCEGLTSYNPRGGTPEPGVAERWDISPDGRLYHFHLRKDARWHNGDPVTAHDFVWSWKRLLTAPLAAQYANMLYPLENAERYFKGEEMDFAQVGVQALGDHLLQVRMHSPTPYFISLLAHYSTFAVHRPTVEKHGAMDDRNSPWTRPENFVCNGPFKLEEWHKDRYLRVVKTDTYWDAERVRLDAVRYLPIDKTTTEERMFRAGQLHLTSTVPPEQIASWKGDPRMHIDPYFGTYFYRLNTTRPPLDDVRVRHALSLALDRRTIVEKVAVGNESPANSFTPPQPEIGFMLDTELHFDPARARALLAEAGYPGGQGIRPLELLYNTSEGHRKVAEGVQEMWRQHLGIDVRLLNQDWKVYLQKQRELQYDISRAGWIGDYEDPNTFLDIMVTDRGNNETGWSNREYDRLVARAASQRGAKRIQTLLRAERILMQDRPVLPLYVYTTKYLKHPDVKGWHANLLDNHPPKHLYLERD